MAALIVETIWLVNGLKRHIVMAAPLTITAPSNVQSLMKSSSRRFDGKSRSLNDRDYPTIYLYYFRFMIELYYKMYSFISLIIVHVC